MHSKIKLLRVRGTRRKDREISADPGIIGNVSLLRCGCTYELIIYAQGDGACRTPLVPVLYEAVLVSMGGQRMLFQGFERQGDQSSREAPAVMQEWAVEVIS